MTETNYDDVKGRQQSVASLIYSAQLLAAITSYPNRPLSPSIFVPTSPSDVYVDVDVGKIVAEQVLNRKSGQKSLQARM